MSGPLCAPRGSSVSRTDHVAAKATDENLTSEDWGAIIEVCDKVSTEPNGPKEVVQSLIKRLAHRNANVQLYTLEVRLYSLPRACFQASANVTTLPPSDNSLPTPSARTAARVSTAKSPAAPSPTPSSS